MLNRQQLLAHMTNVATDGTFIFWYIGENGLKYDGVKYYEKLFKEMRKIEMKKKEAVYLYDLTAWKSLTDLKTSYKSDHPLLPSIQNQGLGSSEFFQWLYTASPEVEKFIHSILARKEIFSASLDFPECGVKIGESFPGFKSLSPIFEMDGSRCYSALQYLEAIYLISRFDNTCNLNFIIPNDETKYYKNQPLQQDLEVYLKLSKKKDVCCKINFVSFAYSNSLRHRPYNAGKKLVASLLPEYFYSS